MISNFKNFMSLVVFAFAILFSFALVTPVAKAAVSEDGIITDSDGYIEKTLSNGDRVELTVNIWKAVLKINGKEHVLHEQVETAFISDDDVLHYFELYTRNYCAFSLRNLIFSVCIYENESGFCSVDSKNHHQIVADPYEDNYIIDKTSFLKYNEETDSSEASPFISFDKLQTFDYRYVEPTKVPDATAEPTKVPDATTEPTKVPDATTEPTKVPNVTPEPTKVPNATVEPTKAPDITPVPTIVPTATVAPTMVPNITVEPTIVPTTTIEPTKAPVVKVSGKSLVKDGKKIAAYTLKKGTLAFKKTKIKNVKKVAFTAKKNYVISLDKKGVLRVTDGKKVKIIAKKVTKLVLSNKFATSYVKAKKVVKLTI